MNVQKRNDHINWSEIWSKYFAAYYQAVPRAGIWISNRFQLRGEKILEIGAGSCRDTIFLLQKGFFAIATDACEEVIYRVQKLYPQYQPMLRCEDAFSLYFEPKSFYLSFSNGLFVLFDDNDIVRLLREQARVTQKYVVALVHNKLNVRLVKNFRDKAIYDPLYNIRFFSPTELLNIVRRADLSFSKVRVDKFGGPIDRLYVITQRLPFFRSFLYWLVPRLYRFQPWSWVERCALVIELESGDRG